MNLIVLLPGEVAPDGAAVLEGARARHVAGVLRAAPGTVVRVGLLDGPLGSAAVERVDAGRVALRCSFAGEAPPRPRVDLLLALPRPKVMHRLFAQLAALGVGRIVLVNAARVEPCYFASHVLDPAHHGPLLIEGLQQARDTRLPEVLVRRRFRPFVEDELDALFPAGPRLVADPGGARRVGEILGGGAGATGRVLAAVGPEGGWVPFELELLAARGFTPVGLGRRALRSDTACVALLGAIADRIPEQAHPVKKKGG